MRPDVVAACGPYRLVVPSTALSGGAGDRMGRGTGASLEFTDFRDYVAGDDLRHVDWRAYARTDGLKVRLFRDEVAPHLDLVLDVSASMAATEAKARATQDLAAAFVHLATRSGSRARAFAAGGDPLPTERPAPLVGPGAGDLLPRAALRLRGLRVVVSDFLVPDDPVPRLRAVAAGGAHLYVVHLLDPWELDPDLEGTTTLVDAEDGTRLDLDLVADVAARYRTRLRRLRDDVVRATRAVGGTYALVPAGDLPTMLRRALAPQRVVEPA